MTWPPYGSSLTRPLVAVVVYSWPANNGGPHTLKPSFAKWQFRKCFLGHSEICVIITWHGLGSGQQATPPRVNQRSRAGRNGIKHYSINMRTQALEYYRQNRTLAFKVKVRTNIRACPSPTNSRESLGSAKRCTVSRHLRHDVDGDGEDDCAVVLCRYAVQCLQVSQLKIPS